MFLLPARYYFYSSCYNCIIPYIIYILQILTDAALLKRQRKEIEELRAKLRVWFSGNSHHMKWVQHPIMKFKVCLSIKSIQLEDTNLHSFLSLELSKWSLGGRNSEFAEHATAGCFLSIFFSYSVIHDYIIHRVIWSLFF